MLIVIVAHADLRDEFAMANEAFALSPIAARAVRPSEADYDAINDAFTETSRGRWFLTEYARRNRNADTRMVLDAVARIETSLAAQKQAPTEDMSAAVADIKALVEQGKAAVASELAKLDVSGHLAPAYKDAQTIRKIVWTLRESGTDLRICDLLDAQAKAIESSLDLLTSAGPREAVRAVFDGLLQLLDSPASQDSTSQPVADTATATITHPTVETAEAWQLAVERTDGPTVLALSRQNLPQLRDSGEMLSAKGAYRLKGAKGPRGVVIVATGSEVEIALAVAAQLEAQGVGADVVSMPSWSRFMGQPQAYRAEILPDGVLRASIEAGTTFG